MCHYVMVFLHVTNEVIIQMLCQFLKFDARCRHNLHSNTNIFEKFKKY